MISLACDASPRDVRSNIKHLTSNIAAFAGLLLNLPESWRHLQTFSRWHRRVKQPDRASAFRKDNDRVAGRDQPADHRPFPLSRRAHGPNRSAASVTQR